MVNIQYVNGHPLPLSLLSFLVSAGKKEAGKYIVLGALFCVRACGCILMLSCVNCGVSAHGGVVRRGGDEV